MERTTHTAPNADTARNAGADTRLTLSQTARIAPGQVSPNCVWRWCRRGVVARSGERVRLEHVRVGGKIYSSARWLEEFGLRLAEADVAYFDLNEKATEPSMAAPTLVVQSRRRPRRSAGTSSAEQRHARAQAELEAEGF